MGFLSIFDVVGPNMVGPSSSHTAGAASIAYVAKKMFAEDINKVTFTLYGSFEKTYRGHGTDKALLGGILGFSSDNLKIKNSFDIAKEMGIEYEFIESSLEAEHPNTADICMESKNGNKMNVRGISIGGGKIKIISINNTPVEFYGEYPTLIVDHKDKKGVVSYITKCLSDANTNIAFMRLYRDAKGENAHSIIESDDKIPVELIEKLKEHTDILNVMLVQI